MQLLEGIERIAAYCCVSKTKATELINNGIIPCIVKKGQLNRYYTYDFLIDNVKERILRNDLFKFDLDKSNGEISNDIFCKYQIEENDVLPKRNAKAVVFGCCNLKGGVGKTTTAISLASAISFLSKSSRVLIVETDPQSNIKLHLSGNSKNGEKCFSDVVLQYLNTKTITPDLEDYMHHYKYVNSSFDALVSDDRMLGKIEDVKDISFLKNMIFRLRDKYDYIIIDTPPSLLASLHQAYVASDFLNLVTTPENMSVEGIRNLISGVQQLNQENIKNGTPENCCEIENTILTKIDGGVKNDQIENLLDLEDILEEFGLEKEKIYRIGNSVVFPESSGKNGKCPIFELSSSYPKALTYAAPYMKLALSIMSRGEK